MPSRILLDPKLPKAFDATPNKRRARHSSINGGIVPTASPVRMVASRFGT